MAEPAFRMLDERPVEYTPLAAQRTYVVRVNLRSYLIAKPEHGGYSGQWLTAITPDTLLKRTAQELMEGRPFIGVDGKAYIIQK